MWDLDPKYLQKDEVIEYTDRPSMLSCIFAYIWTGLMMLPAITMLILSMTTVNDADKTSIRPVIFMHVLFASPAIYVILRRLSTRYVISNRGLLRRTRVVSTSMWC